MAIAGSGGWVPSAGVNIHLGRLKLWGYTQNKPRSVIRTTAEAVAILSEMPSAIVQIDVRENGIGRLRAALYAAGKITSMDAV